MTREFIFRRSQVVATFRIARYPLGRDRLPLISLFAAKDNGTGMAGDHQFFVGGD